MSSPADVTLASTVSIPREVMARAVGDETVILDLASGSYFGLDRLGTRIWELLTQGRQPAEVRDTLLHEYEVTPEQLEADLLRLLVELRSAGLIATA